jgi:glucose/arabinose dehydrogenase
LLGLTLEVIGDDFAQPTLITHAPGDDRLFVVERRGTVIAVTPTGERTTYLDLTDVVVAAGIEQGLLGLAFHPEYETNRRLFVYYTDAEANSRLAALVASDDGRQVDPTTLSVILAFDQFGDRHYAGMLQFGPDGYLYVATGDGAKASEHGQFPDTLLAAILRLDVDAPPPATYGVPADNPFARGEGGAAEVWAYGLRNPWRFTIDPVENLMYIADVGQERWEEINVVPLEPVGYNFGWLDMEGSHCFTAACDAADPVLPVLEYSHDEGCSVTGGVVYRGATIPELEGHFLYSDWCRGWIRSFRHVDGTVTEQEDWSNDMPPSLQVNSFGVDHNDEVHVALWDGTVAKLVPIR